MAADERDLRPRVQRLVHLITYSRANLNKFKDRRSFAEAVAHAWRETTASEVIQWVVCREIDANTSDADDVNTFHYHMALKLSKRSRWLSVRNYLDQHYGIQVHFSAHHNTYYSAYRYTVKDDPEYLLSDDQPRLANRAPPRPEKAIARHKAKAGSGDAGGRRKRRKRGLSVYEVSELIQTRRIKIRVQLMALAASQNREGKSDLAMFICNRGTKVVDECLAVAEELSSAEEKRARMEKTRVEILQEVRDSQCAPGCNGQYHTAAITALERNEIPVNSFAKAIYDALELGRGKYRNIYIHGPANSGKTFILSPLKVIYKSFSNPATGTNAWVGAEEAEVIFLNDFRWKPSIIALADLLQLLEGDSMHLPAPKNFCKRDIEMTRDTPVFATADAPLTLVKGTSIDHANTEMMNVRWRFFQFLAADTPVRAIAPRSLRTLFC